MAFSRKNRPRTTPAPSNLTASGNVSFVRLAWELTSTPSGFTRFDIYRDGSLLDDTTLTVYDDTSAADGVEYDYTVKTVRTNPRSLLEYSSAASNTASGQWVSESAAEIEIVSVTSSTSGVDIAVNAVTGADHYRLLRSTDPLSDFAQVGSDSATTSLTDTTGTAGTFYFYKVQPVASSVAGTASRSRAGSKIGATSGDPVAYTSMTLRPNYNTIHIDVVVSGDADQTARCHAEFGLTELDGTITWRHCQPLRRVGTHFVGAAVELESGTPYQIRMKLTDSGGVSGVNADTGSTTTRTDDVLDHATLLAAVDHYVSSTGNDTTGTGASDAPWKTINKAITSANAGVGTWTVQVGAGYFTAPTTKITRNGVRFVALNPAIDDATATDHAPYNTADAHTIVYGRYVAPAASDADATSADTSSTVNYYGRGGWTTYTPTSTSYTVYQKDVGTNNIAQVGYTVAADYASYTLAKAAEPNRLCDIKKDTVSGRLLNTLDGFCQFIHTNVSYNAGFWQDGSTNILYLLLPDGLSPNNCYLWMSRYGFSESNTVTAFDIQASDVAIAGFNARVLANGFRFQSAATDVDMDRNYTRGCGCPYLPRPATNGVGALRVTIQNFRSEDSNLWNEDLSGIPWELVKQQAILADGVTAYPLNKLAVGGENSVVKFYKGGAQWVIRRGEIKGLFNGIGSNGSSTDIGAQRDHDIHDIRFSEIADNCIEPEGMATGWVGWNLHARNVRSFFSTDSDGGAHMFYRWTIWRWGVHGIAPIIQGEADHALRGGNGQLVKFGAGSNPRPNFTFLNWTAWTDQSGSKGWGKGIGSSSQEKFRSRNGLLRAPEYLIENQATITEWDMDANFMACEAAANATGAGVFVHGVYYNASATTGANSLAALRTAGYAGANDNKKSGTDYNFVSGGLAVIDGLFTNTATGDLTLLSSFPGVPLANISDDGSTPDRGWEG